MQCRSTTLRWFLSENSLWLWLASLMGWPLTSYYAIILTGVVTTLITRVVSSTGNANMTRWFCSEATKYVDLCKFVAVQLTYLSPKLPPSQRQCISYINWWDELERKFRFIGSDFEKFSLEVKSAGDSESFLKCSIFVPRNLAPSLLMALKSNLNHMENNLKDWTTTVSSSLLSTTRRSRFNNRPRRMEGPTTRIITNNSK